MNYRHQIIVYMQSWNSVRQRLDVENVELMRVLRDASNSGDSIPGKVAFYFQDMRDCYLVFTELKRMGLECQIASVLGSVVEARMALLESD